MKTEPSLPISFPFCILALALWSSLYTGSAGAAANLFDNTVLHPAIPLLDEQGLHVANSGQPYSPRMSCGNGSGSGCHDYDKINHAYHFEQGRDEAADDFGAGHGLPQLVSPGYFGGYNCMGISNPGWLARKTNARDSEFGDFGAAGMVKQCQTCHAGGGWGELDRGGIRYDAMDEAGVAALDGDYFDRAASPEGSRVVRWDWKKSGVRENDCMICHADFAHLKKFPASQLGASDGADGTDPPLAQWRTLQDGKFVQAGFFRHAASALWEFLDVHPETAEGMALLTVARTPSAQGPNLPGYDLVLNGAGTPVLRWNRDAFDREGKASIPMRRFPASDNCMVCHDTGYSRRGFFGFGEESRQIRQADGTLLPDHRDDVHKGTSFTQDNGETRVIDNCNACHSREYYKSLYANVNLDADHQFPKGNGDNDIRNDLDRTPPALSCEYCHDTAKHPALPSGQKNVLDAHRVVWKISGDLAGYPEEVLNKITQTHLDVVACQTCHIKGLADADGKPIAIHYRYRYGDDRKLKLFPYNPAYRYYARDKTSGRVLYQWERNSAFETRTGADGQPYGAIVDARNHQELGKVALVNGAFGEPDSYEGYKGLKQAYDRLLQARGYANPDVRFVFIESNDYVISHNSRPSAQAVACAECHARKQSGAYSALLSADGLLGENRTLEVAKLPDRRLVDEGIFELGMPYYRVDASGRITENIADVFYASRLDPSMTILKAETARSIGGEFKSAPANEAAGFAGIEGEAAGKLAGTMNSGEWLLFNSTVGHSTLRGFALMLPGNQRNQLFAKGMRAGASSREAEATERRRIRKLKAGSLASDVYSVALLDQARARVTAFADGDGWMKLPYRGKAKRPKRLRVVWSDDGRTWRKLPVKDIVAVQPRNGDSEGYVLFRVSRPYAHLALAEKNGKAP